MGPRTRFRGRIANECLHGSTQHHTSGERPDATRDTKHADNDARALECETCSHESAGLQKTHVQCHLRYDTSMGPKQKHETAPRSYKPRLEIYASYEHV